MRRSLVAVVSTAALVSSLFSGAAYAGGVVKPTYPSVVGNGSSFQANFETACTALFNASTPAGYKGNGNVAYTGTSSTTGTNAFVAGTADFAGTDGPSASTVPADGGALVVVPLTAAPVAFIYNVRSMVDGSQILGIKLNPSIINDIYRGTVTYWDDAAIEVVNGGKYKAATRTTPAGYTGGLSAKLPHVAIKVNVRANGSGTTKNLNLYMAANAGAGNAWNTSGSKNWGASGSDNVFKDGTSIASIDTRATSDAMVTAVTGTNGAFGYADAPDAATAQANKDLGWVLLKNVHGEYQAPTVNASQKLLTAGEAAAGLTTNGFLSSTESKALYTADVSGAYQLTVVTYVIASAKNTAKNNAVYAYVKYALKSCQGKGGFTRLTPAMLVIADSQAAKIGATS